LPALPPLPLGAPLVPVGPAALDPPIGAPLEPLEPPLLVPLAAAPLVAAEPLDAAAPELPPNPATLVLIVEGAAPLPLRPALLPLPQPPEDRIAVASAHTHAIRL
jgi:hypothetical protein